MTRDYIETEAPCEVHYDDEGSPANLVIYVPAGVTWIVKQAPDRAQLRSWRQAIKVHDAMMSDAAREDAALLGSDTQREESAA